jgi:hypothetical protein
MTENENARAVTEAIIAAFNEEAEEIDDPKTNHALRMKYGLSAVVLIPTEKYAILRENNEV